MSLDSSRGDGGRGSLAGDRRGLTPAVGKALEIGVVVAFVGVLSASLYGGVVPAYRAAAGDEVADRTVAAAAERIEASIPPAAREVRAAYRVRLPTSIRGANYRVVVENRSLVLDHPDSAVDARTRLALPDRVASVAGAWESGAETVVVVTDAPGGLTVELTDRRALAESDGSDGADGADVGEAAA